MGVGRGGGETPTEGMGGGGGNKRNIRETAVDESRQKMADRVARHQAD